MTRLSRWIFCLFLAACTVGCGGSNNDYNDYGGIQGGPYPVSTGGFRVLLSNADLVDLLPIPIPANVPDSGDPLFDAGVDQLVVSAYDATDGTLVVEALVDYFPGTSLDLVLDELNLLPYDVVLFALDANGNSLAEAEANNVSFFAGGLTLLTFQDFFTTFSIGDL